MYDYVKPDHITSWNYRPKFLKLLDKLIPFISVVRFLLVYTTYRLDINARGVLSYMEV